MVFILARLLTGSDSWCTYNSGMIDATTLVEIVVALVVVEVTGVDVISEVLKMEFDNGTVFLDVEVEYCEVKFGVKEF